MRLPIRHSFIWNLPSGHRSSSRSISTSSQTRCRSQATHSSMALSLPYWTGRVPAYSLLTETRPRTLRPPPEQRGPFPYTISFHCPIVYAFMSYWRFPLAGYAGKCRCVTAETASYCSIDANRRLRRRYLSTARVYCRQPKGTMFKGPAASLVGPALSS